MIQFWFTLLLLDPKTWSFKRCWAIFLQPMIHSKPHGELWLHINIHWLIYKYGCLMKIYQFTNNKLRLPKATPLHWTTPRIFKFQAIQGGIALALQSLGALVEMFHELFCCMSNKKHVSTKPKKLKLKNKSLIVATMERLVIGTRSAPNILWRAPTRSILNPGIVVHSNSHAF